jgi:hypothetical protein
VTASGPLAGPAVQNGVFVQNDEVRYIWKIRALNPGVGAHDLIVYAADAANTQRRVIARFTIGAGAVFEYPAQPEIDRPILRVPPNTGVAPTQENGIYCSDEGAGGQITNISMSVYSKHG